MEQGCCHVQVVKNVNKAIDGVILRAVCNLSFAQR